jgi:hypothetical protein
VPAMPYAIVRRATVPLLLLAAACFSDDLPRVVNADAQPLKLHVQRLREAFETLGEPLAPAVLSKLDAAAKTADPHEAAALIQSALDPLCLAGVQINPESRVKVSPGPAPRDLLEQGWRLFLVKVQNDAGVTAALRVNSPQAQPLAGSPADQVEDRWLAAALFGDRPLEKSLSGAKLEYRLLQLYSRDPGKRSALLSFDIGQGSQDLGFRSDLTLTFDAAPASSFTFHVADENGKPSMAAFVIRDGQGRVHPSQSKRLAPDFAFHPQVYRADGEQIKLPAGRYAVEVTHGPEYLAQKKELVVGASGGAIDVKLHRWIDPSLLGWYSGDHHIHAAGCAHYTNPTEGVKPADMERQITGEDLKIGAALTWGPCFDYQKQFFTGAEDKASLFPYLLRYDVEVSGFGSHQSGHLVLLNLKNQIYPGGDSDKHWPTLCLSTLRWAKAQGAVVGPARSGWGLAQKGTTLPTYEVPPFDGIGACEYIADVTHLVPGLDGKPVPAVDFISTVDTPYTNELNIWYHTLNCGYRTRVSGETDFPCIYGERVGIGRAYVKLDGKLSYEAWCLGVRAGRAYVGDGRSHLIDFTVNGVELGTRESEVKLAAPGSVKVTAKVAALLPEKPDPAMRNLQPGDRPYWHVERARLGDSRQVKLELLVNGYPVAAQPVDADGQLRDVAFDAKIDRSSWVALRILPSSHTNPVFVIVEGKPIRASKRSAQWCLDGVERCWSQKQRFIAPGEMEEAKRVYDHARQEYRRILAESEVD